MYVVEVEDLHKSFGSIKALRGLNAVFPKGICGLIGPNGSGKTTFIHILMGLVRPDRGKAFVLGFDCWRDSVEIRRRIGVLLEDMYFPGHITVREYIEHIVRIKGGDRGDVLEIAEDIGLERYLNRKIHTLSAGMFKMLGLMQALVGEPELVILDEPSANLDPLKRRNLLEYIMKVGRERDVSFLISSHVLPELEEICEWIVLIYEGRAVDQGSLGDLYAKYGTNEYEVVSDKPRLLAKLIKEYGVGEVLYIHGNRVNVSNTCYREFTEFLYKFSKDIKIFSFKPVGGLENVFRQAIKNISERAG